MNDKPDISKAYIVTKISNVDDSEVCTYTRGVWNVIGTGRFFAYESDATMDCEAIKCSECDGWNPDYFMIQDRCIGCAHTLAQMV